MDKKLGTRYAERVEGFRKYVQKNDIATALLMTDVKGDRSLRPSEQKLHKDYYLRIVEQSRDGIIIRGAKAHASWAPCSNELIILPCRAMKEEDKEYAIACAVPPNTDGIIMVQPERPVNFKEPNSWLDYPISSGDYSPDAVVVFNNVFVPNERVFMKEEWQLSGDLVHMFANFHRLMANIGKYAEIELLVGAAILAAEYNGLEKVSHIRNKIAWLMYYAEGLGALSQLACINCLFETETKLAYPNPMYTNMVKFMYADNFHQALKYVQDIAGGLLSTAPSSEDFLNSETGPLLEKYLRGKSEIPTEKRFKIMKLIADLSNVHKQVGAIHAEGSLQSQLLSIYALGDFEKYKAAAKRAGGIKDDKLHPVFSQLPDYPIR
jgi:4-hydroxybutyryl-CoA dehydratase/vinylacetyl-CoA-Delta-isomerase